MFEQALSPEAWKPHSGGRGLEASEQLSILTRNLGGYGSTAVMEPVPMTEEPGLALSAEALKNAPVEPEAAAAQESSQEAEPVASWVLDAPERLFAVFGANCPTSYLEQFQLLRTQLLLLRSQCAAEDDLRCICLTSARSGEGKTFTARNLAATLATASGKKVLLVETGPRERLVPEGVLGLDAALLTPENWLQSVAEIATSGLSILPGPAAPQVTDFEPLPALIARVRSHYDWVVIDGPAIHNSAAAEWVVAAADATLLVVRQGETTFDSVGDALTRIPRERLAGVVMNKLPGARRRSWLPRVRIRWSRSKA